MLTEALEKKDEEHIKFEEFSGLEEKYYMQNNIIEGLKVDNDKLTEKINYFARQNEIVKAENESGGPKAVQLMSVHYADGRHFAAARVKLVPFAAFEYVAEKSEVPVTIDSLRDYAHHLAEIADYAAEMKNSPATKYRVPIFL